MTGDILSRFNDSVIVEINHYKDIFNRPGQDSFIQDRSKKLILAVNDGKKVFEASPVCQDMGLGSFYYVQSAMNCVFSCDYCFLKGMYAASNIVIFVNSGDYLAEVSYMLAKRPLYLCASFDTDLAAISGICGWKRIWEEFAIGNPELTLELRTKSAVKDFRNAENIIYAFTLSPDEVINRFEKGTPSLGERIKTVNRAISLGAQVRLCFDPMIYIRDWEVCYNYLARQVTESIDLTKIRDISIGTFRISSGYLGNLRKASPGSSSVLFPFERENGYCVYPKSLRSEMTELLKTRFEEAGFGYGIYIER